MAFHECGHALVASLVPGGDPVSKISIIPRSRGALGYTMQMPKEDRYLVSLEELGDQIAIMMGGRAAEQLMVGTISTGAVDDMQRASQLAKRMVTEFSMRDFTEPLEKSQSVAEPFSCVTMQPSTRAGPLLSEPAGNPSGGHADHQTDASGHRHGLQRLTLHVMDTLVFDVFQPLDTALHRFVHGPFRLVGAVLDRVARQGLDQACFMRNMRSVSSGIDDAIGDIRLFALWCVDASDGHGSPPSK